MRLSLRLRGLVLITACLFGASPLYSQSNEFRGLWVPAWTAGFWNSSQTTTLLNDTRSGNMNALIIQARRRGDSFYNSNFEPKCIDMAAGYDSLADLIAKGHDTSGGKQKVEIHAWLVTYHIWKTESGPMPPQPDHPLNLHPDWLLSDVNGNTLIDGQYTFDPGHPGVQQHTFNVCMDIVTNYNVDGLNFDYIRYNSINEGYNSVTVARFNQRYNRTGQPSPSDALWKQFRRDQVTALVRKVYLSAIAARPEVKISADTITWAPGPTSDETWYSSSAAWNSVLQDWRGWMEEGILDMSVPMNYFRQTTHPTDYINWSNFAKNHRFNRHTVNGPGIWLNSVANTIVQMRQTRQATSQGEKADGVCGYAYNDTNSDNLSRSAFLNALVNTTTNDPVSPPIFSTKVPVPTMPWKTAPTKGHLKGMIYGTGTNGLDGGTVAITGAANKEMLTDATGFYGTVDLPPGSYTATATFPGYFAKTTNFTVTVGVVTTVDFQLNLANFTITSHPQNTTVNTGANANFSVTANGTPPLTYQWRFSGTNISGATSSTYTVNGAQIGNAGNYSVFVSNLSGSILSSNAFLTVNAPPFITSHPQSLSVNQGSNVTFSVTATGTATLRYQWRFNGASISGATLSSYTRNNVQPSDAGQYSVFITNSVGTATSSNATLVVSEVITPPIIISHPQNQSVTEGQPLTFSVAANGSLPLAYQWRHEGTNISGANGSIYAITAAATSQVGNYSVAVSNIAGFAISQNASLTVLPPFRAASLELLWKLGPNDRPYITNNGSLPTERGVAFNPITGNVLIVSRASGTKMFVLDGDTGLDRWQMNTDSSIVNGGTYALNIVGVADDGAVYAGNLATTNQPFRLYRWPTDSADAVPMLVYEGDPGAGTLNRWGDTLDVRGAGTTTQILIASRNGTLISVLTTANGTNFSSKKITISGVSGGSFGLGAAFGRGDTFLGKAGGVALRRFAFNLDTGTGTVTQTYPTSAVPTTITAIGVNHALNMIGGVSLATPDMLLVYQLSTDNTTTRLVDSEAFSTDNANVNQTGSVDFGDDRVYSFDSNNGLVAMRILPTIAPRIEAVGFPPGKVRLYLSDTSETNIVEATSTFTSWQTISNVVQTNGFIEFNDSGSNAHRFYRTKIP